jgi:hypothetical protein
MVGALTGFVDRAKSSGKIYAALTNCTTMS